MLIKLKEWWFWWLLLVVVAGLLTGMGLMQPSLKYASANTETQVTETTSTDKKNPKDARFVAIEPFIHSKNVFLLDSGQNQILLNKEGDAKTYAASLIKVMTVLVAIEHIEDMQEYVEVPADIYLRLLTADASMAGFYGGENVTYQDLLYGAMLPSGGEACETLAITLAGDQQNFLKWMNDKAKDMGMKNTHFDNVTGLHSEKNVSSAMDIAILFQEALKNPIFRQIATADSYTTSETPDHPEGITLTSLVYEKALNYEQSGFEILGGKTGFTEEAGLCMVTVASKDNHEYILVTLGAVPDSSMIAYSMEDAIMIYGSL